MTGAIVSAVLLYVFYTQDPVCIENKLFIGINAVLCILICILSVLPCTRRLNRNSGLLQGTVISLYVMYLTWSALISEPPKEVLRPHTDDNGTAVVLFNCSMPVLSDESALHFDPVLVSCGPPVLSRMWQMASGYVGAILMLIMAVYASLMTSHRAKRLGIQPPVGRKVLCCCGNSDTDIHNDMIRGGQPVTNDETEQVVYSYAFFHLVFALGSLYIMMQLTMWYKPHGSKLSEFGKNWPSVWVKMVSSWVCIFVYVWTLFVPKCLPGRDYSFIQSLADVKSHKRHDGTLVYGHHLWLECFYLLRRDAVLFISTPLKYSKI
jgi:hypothetical protein